MPADVKLNIPIPIPIYPCFSAACIAPCNRECPKLVIGTVAPAPANLIRLSYNPNPSKTAPITTKVAIKWAGVNFAKSNNTCPTTQIAPPTRNAYIKSTIHSPFTLSNTTPCAIVGIVSFCCIIIGLNKAPVATTKIRCKFPFCISLNK